jgi:hypothetical protein
MDGETVYFDYDSENLETIINSLKWHVSHLSGLSSVRWHYRLFSFQALEKQSAKPDLATLMLNLTRLNSANLNGQDERWDILCDLTNPIASGHFYAVLRYMIL